MKVVYESSTAVGAGEPHSHVGEWQQVAVGLHDHGDDVNEGLAHFRRYLTTVDDVFQLLKDCRQLFVIQA